MPAGRAWGRHPFLVEVFLVELSMSQLPMRRESEAIRDQMNQVRGRLPHAADIARAEMSEYLSWKHYVRRYPLVAAAIVIVVAYRLVPSRRPRPVIVSGGGGWRRWRRQPEHADTAEVASKASLFGMATSLLTSLALKGATTYFSGHLQDYVTQYAAAKRAAKQQASAHERSVP